MLLQDTAEYLFRFGNIVAIGNAEYEVYAALTLGGDVLDNVLPDFRVGQYQCLVIKGEHGRVHQCSLP